MGHNLAGQSLLLYNIFMQDVIDTEPVPQAKIHILEPQEEREDIQEMACAVEALLFASADMMGLNELRRVLAVRQPTLDRVLDYLGQTLSDGKRGVRLQKHAGQVRLVTAPEMAMYVDKMLGQPSSQRLSDAALESLALLAYYQPTTRPHLEAIRGVDCSGVINTLLARGLVEEVGRLDTVGHPILYGTTPAFLQHFGLESPQQLPAVGEIVGRSPSSPPQQKNQEPIENHHR
jgi:segregation and condensation protein B